MTEKIAKPQLRFAGFDDTWEQRKLGEVGKARSGVGFPDTEQGGTIGVPFFKVSDMNSDGNENEMTVANNYVMVCRPRNKMALGYLGYYLNSDAYHHQLLPLMQGIKVLSLSRTNVQKTMVCYPKSKAEQQLIADCFRNLDNLITLHQRESTYYTGGFYAEYSPRFGIFFLFEKENACKRKANEPFPLDTRNAAPQYTARDSQSAARHIRP